MSSLPATPTVNPPVSLPVPQLARSLLFVPGDRPERYAKALASGAHDVVLDLEDAVAPAAKDAAREAVGAWLREGNQALVRVNAIDTPWFDDDMAMLRSVPGAGVMLPKADTASTAHTLRVLPGRRVIALVETVAGYLDLKALVALDGLARIAFGSVDFSTESGIADEGDAMTAIRTNIVLASCHAGLEAPVDGVSLEFRDEAIMRADALRSRQLGFGGKLCIHPNQVAAVNGAYQPTAVERDWAQRVLAAFQESRGAATAVDGKMIDKPVVERARRIAATPSVMDSASCEKRPSAG
ncbi:CoA ester lyase [Pigmentiphaga aceris]|uniref:CoA ester lyase n=1 Tax=Pigmentiphaga aceris TaxID=1940612 RepID=A0A5C0AZX0_9BURK|nr:CoA ester lyase [Pigmentiphaga aceris]QEI06410.1 CoA ester lyase [Pigmentiphaga aceris]